jgi:hypothetical protein
MRRLRERSASLGVLPSAILRSLQLRPGLWRNRSWVTAAMWMAGVPEHAPHNARDRHGRRVAEVPVGHASGDAPSVRSKFGECFRVDRYL